MIYKFQFDTLVDSHLAAYQAHALSAGMSVYATYLLSGDVQVVPGTIPSQEKVSSSGAPALRHERKLVIVGEDELESSYS